MRKAYLTLVHKTTELRHAIVLSVRLRHGLTAIVIASLAAWWWIICDHHFQRVATDCLHVKCADSTMSRLCTCELNVTTIPAWK